MRQLLLYCLHSRHLPVDRSILVIRIRFEHPVKARGSFCILPKTELAETHQIIAVVDIFLRHICVKHGHIRYGDRKVIHLENIPDMLLSIIHEPVESLAFASPKRPSFAFASP